MKFEKKINFARQPFYVLARIWPFMDGNAHYKNVKVQRMVN